MRGRGRKIWGGNEDSRFRAGGYMTVFLSLLVMILLSLFLLLLKGTRRSGAKMQLESAFSSSENAVLAEFHRELFEQYDLFMVDTSYRTGEGSTEKLSQRLRSYLEQNTTLQVGSVSVTSVRLACDNNAQSVAEQIYAYMSGVPGSEVVNSILVSADRWRGLEISGREWTAKLEESEAEALSEMKKSSSVLQGDSNSGSGSDGNDSGDGSGTSVTQEQKKSANDAQSMVEESGKFQRLPVLTQVFGETSQLSARAIDLNRQISHRNVKKGNGLLVRNRHGYPRADAVLTDMYIAEKCGAFSKEKINSPLQYEIEYILCGKENDRKNLEGVAGRLLLIRMGANCGTLYKDEKRMAEVKGIATIVSLVLLTPELKEPVQNVLALAWAYLESVQDVRILFDGGKVPLQKAASDWRTGLLDLLTPSMAVRRKESNEGFSYEQYLQGLLFMEGGTKKMKRLMDVMEMNIRTTKENQEFRLDECADAFAASGTATGSDGSELTIMREAGYN